MMRGDYRLIHRVEPYEHEDVYGFLMRVAERNRFTGGFVNLLAHVNGTASCRLREKDLSKLAHFCRNTLPEIAQLSGIERKATHGDVVWKVEGGWVSKASFIRPRWPLICPLCLWEKSYIRGIWSLSFYTACARHGVKLVGSCSKCKKAIKWNRQSVQICGCGFDLTRSPLIEPQAEELLVAELFAYSLGLKDSVSQSHSLDLVSVNRFASLSVDAICKTIWFLGHCVAQHGKFGTGHGHFQPRGNEAVGMIKNAIELLSEWPKSLGQKLHCIAASTPTKGNDASISRLLGPIQHFLEEEINTEELTYIRHSYEQHIRGIWRSMGRRVRLTNNANQFELEFEQ